MNKGELIESVHHHLREREVSKALAADAVNAVLHAIHHSLPHDGHVSIAGFRNHSALFGLPLVELLP